MIKAGVSQERYNVETVSIASGRALELLHLNVNHSFWHKRSNSFFEDTNESPPLQCHLSCLFNVFSLRIHILQPLKIDLLPLQYHFQ
jgi:hypothetical protein